MTFNGIFNIFFDENANWKISSDKSIADVTMTKKAEFEDDLGIDLKLFLHVPNNCNWA